MKSAYELAMSRLEKSDPVRKITDAQKELLRTIDSEFDAKVAERRIFLEGEMAKSANDPGTLDSLWSQLAAELATLEEKREARKESVRRET